MPASQTNSNLAINTMLGTDKVLLVSASISEQLGRMFRIEADLTSEDANLPFDTIVGSNATIRVTLPNSKTPRYFNGYVSRFVQTEASNTGGVYRATLVPWLWFLTRTSDCRIFQNKTVPDIMKEIFSLWGLGEVKDKLTSTYASWENCVQYRETDFNFVSRLMEHEGIYYYFEHQNGKHTMVLCDSASAHESFPSYDTVPFRPQRGSQWQMESVAAWSTEQEVQPGTYALNDFNFETPKTSLIAQSTISAQSHLSTLPIYDYPGEYGKQHEGSEYAKIRIEELHSQYEIAHGSGNSRGLAVGYTFSLTNCPRRDQNRKYLITEASYQLVGDNYVAGTRSGTAPTEEEMFRCDFSVLEAAKPYRAVRATPKPLIQGPQTAIVVGTSGEEIYTDKYARVKVQFHWDRYGKADENSSCWLRVSQAWAGKLWGAMYIPRVGQEVIVEFLEGNPDLPIVTGRVYNAETMPPYDLPAQKTKSTLKTNSSKGGGGFNEFRIEDKKGSEQIFIHGEKDLDVRVKNDRLETIMNDRHLHVVNNKFEKVDANRHEEIGTSHFEKIGTDHNMNIGGKQAIHITGSQSVGIDGDMVHEIKGKSSQKVTGTVYVSAQGDLVIESAASITIKVGGSSIAMDSSGITLKATTIELKASSTLTANSDGTATLKAASSLEASSTGSTTVKGASSLEASSGGTTTVKGASVMIN